MYETISSRMSSIIDLIGLEHLELSALELETFAIFCFVYTLDSICKYTPIGTKLWTWVQSN